MPTATAKVKAAPKTELETVFPLEREVCGFTVRPYTFGQMGKVLRIIAPYTAGIDLSNLDASMQSLNLNVLIYAVTDGDCAGIYELITLATDSTLEQIEPLSFESGIELLTAVWEVSVKPELDRLGKRLLKAKAEPAAEPVAATVQDGPTASST